MVSKLKESPIIGILSQETYIVAKYVPKDENGSFIAASYVKFLESAGARVVPIWIGQNKEYYEKAINYTNGVLFPGGGTFFNESHGYGEAAKYIYEIALELNKRGIYYPIFGICLGMQAIFYSRVGYDIREDVPLKHVSVHLDFTNDYATSKLYSTASKQLIQILKSKNVTYNLHQYAITEKILEEHNLLEEWKILSTNIGEDKNVFISSLEHKHYPIYGLQFHPEKNNFEFKNNNGLHHSSDAVKVSQYFANFFVDECRKNNNAFPNEDIENECLIYNYCPIYTGRKGSSLAQLYLFTKDDYNKCPLV